MIALLVYGALCRKVNWLTEFVCRFVYLMRNCFNQQALPAVPSTFSLRGIHLRYSALVAAILRLSRFGGADHFEQRLSQRIVTGFLYCNPTGD